MTDQSTFGESYLAQLAEAEKIGGCFFAAMGEIARKELTAPVASIQ